MARVSLTAPCVHFARSELFDEQRRHRNPGRLSVTTTCVYLAMATEATMYTHILISSDGSTFAQKGVDHGLSLAKALGSKVTVVTATEPFPTPVGAAGWVITTNAIASYQADCKKASEELLASVKAQAEKMGVVAETIHVPDSRAATAILETARNAECNLIVMASHGRRGVRRILLGSQAAEVVSNSQVPVLIVR